MKMMIRDGRVTLLEVPPSKAQQIKKTNRMRWDRETGSFTAPASLGLLESLAGVFRFPQPYAAILDGMIRNRAAMEDERTKETPEALYEYPVKRTLYRHQVRAANMALLAFGLIEGGRQNENPDPGK